MRRYLSPGWLLGHFVALVLFTACLALGWWQVRRAGEGNLRSYAYAVEWPVFAGFVAFVWLREIRRAQAGPAQESDEHSEQRARVAVPPSPPDHDEAAAPPASDPDDELAAYNRMLAWLKANPGRRMSDYPG
ncbi:MAG: hypothetical protein ACRDJ9_21740 [Dehalococcoidia bacterium]